MLSPYFTRMFRLFARLLPGRWRQYAAPAGAWLLLSFACIFIVLVNDPPWPTHLTLLASIA